MSELGLLAIMAAAVNASIDIAGVQQGTKASAPCMLPGCGKLTSHNGGYCCAEHAKRHKLERKRK